MAHRPGETISFYTDKTTAEKLRLMAKDSRSISEHLTDLINKEWVEYGPKLVRAAIDTLTQQAEK